MLTTTAMQSIETTPRAAVERRSNPVPVALRGTGWEHVPATTADRATGGVRLEDTSRALRPLSFPSSGNPTSRPPVPA